MWFVGEFWPTADRQHVKDPGTPCGAFILPWGRGESAWSVVEADDDPALDAGERQGVGLDQRSLSRVIGSSRMRLPVALNTALATAAATPVIPISPMPCAPAAVWSSGMSA